MIILTKIKKKKRIIIMLMIILLLMQKSDSDVKPLHKSLKSRLFVALLSSITITPQRGRCMFA